MSEEMIVKIHDPIFKQTFLVYCNYSFDAFHKEVLNKDYNGENGVCDVLDGYCINTDNAEICIWLKDHTNIPAIIHELQHAMQYALYDRCFVDSREYELPAYYMEFLIREFLELSTRKVVKDESGQ